MVIKIYMDYGSQPSRAVLALCLACNVPHQVIQIKMFEMEHRKPQYLKINPMRLVPAIYDTQNDFYLVESHSILRYICNKYDLPEQWYPRNNIMKQAKIDQFFDFHHSNTRKCSYLAFHLLFAPILKTGDPTFNEKFARKIVGISLKNFEKIYLKDNKFIGGQNPCVADLTAFFDISMLEVLDYDYSPYPKIQKWILQMRKIKAVQLADQKFQERKQAVKSLNPAKAKL